MPKIHSIPYWTRVSLVSLLLWLTWFWFTNRSLLLIYDCRLNWLTTQVRTNHSVTCSPFTTSGRTENRSPSPAVHVIMCSFVAAGTCVTFVATLWYTSLSLTVETYLASRCLAMDVSAVLLWLHPSDAQASCHNIKYLGCTNWRKFLRIAKILSAFQERFYFMQCQSNKCRSLKACLFKALRNHLRHRINSQ
jgi:hypothetical protein